MTDRAPTCEYVQVTSHRGNNEFHAALNDMGSQGWRALAAPEWRRPDTTMMGDLGTWSVWMERAR